MTTSAPSRAKAIAAARPIPESPPGHQSFAVRKTPVSAIRFLAVVRFRLHLPCDPGNALRLMLEFRKRVLLRRILQRIKIGHERNLTTFWMRVLSSSSDSSLYSAPLIDENPSNGPPDEIVVPEELRLHSY
jgi:hypothetical protein